MIAAIGDDKIGESAKFDDAAAAGLGSAEPIEIERDGARNVVSVRRSFVTGWQAIAWVPASVIEAPMWSSILLLGLAGLGLLLLTALLSVLLARWVARPIKRLAGQARALGHGEMLPVLNSPVREVNEVSQTLAVAAEERKKTEDHIRFLMRELSHRAKNQLAVVDRHGAANLGAKPAACRISRRCFPSACSRSPARPTSWSTRTGEASPSPNWSAPTSNRSPPASDRASSSRDRTSRSAAGSGAEYRPRPA